MGDFQPLAHVKAFVVAILLLWYNNNSAVLIPTFFISDHAANV
jgi:hypothetical protein